MSRLLVFASAFSRLHADLIIVRLKRAGIDPALISLLHPVSSRPNSARCWLGGSAKLRLASGEKIAVSGFLRPDFDELEHDAPSHSFDDLLSHLGLSHEHRVSLEETLLENRVVIAVNAVDKSEIPTVIQTLQRAGGEKLIAAEVVTTQALRSPRGKFAKAA